MLPEGGGAGEQRVVVPFAVHQVHRARVAEPPFVHRADDVCPPPALPPVGRPERRARDEALIEQAQRQLLDIAGEGVVQHQPLDDRAGGVTPDLIESAGTCPCAEIEIGGVLHHEHDRSIVIADAPEGLLAVRGEHGVQVNSGVCEEAAGALDLGPGLEAARQSLAAVAGEINQQRTKPPIKACVAEGDGGELVLDPLLGTGAHDHRPSAETVAYATPSEMWVKLSLGQAVLGRGSETLETIQDHVAQVDDAIEDGTKCVLERMRARRSLRHTRRRSRNGWSGWRRCRRSSSRT